MLTLTIELKKHMTDNFSVAATASDEDFRKAVGDAIVSGKLTIETVTQLTTVKSTEAELRLKTMIAEGVKNAMLSQAPVVAAPAEAVAPAGTGAKAYGSGAASGTGVTSPEYDSVRVKSVVEQFNDHSTTATWDKSANDYMAKNFSGQSVVSHMEHQPYTVNVPSDRQKAIAGAWFKMMALRSFKGAVPRHLQMKEYELDLVKYAAHNSKFIGEVNDVEYEGEKLAGDLAIKAVLDDSTSGGLEAVPIEFDSSVIFTPLLSGELFPLVSITNVNRRRIEAMKIANMTFGWGTASGTAISLFNTDSLISAFDNTIYPVVGAVEVGLDFLADSPVAIGRMIIDNYGRKFAQEMDNVIATGNGTNQPEGLFNASGVTVVTPSGSGAAPVIGDYEGLLFGIAKEYRQEAGFGAGSRAVFIGTDTSYARARGIPVDNTDDARRVFGMDHESYRLFDHSYRINGSLTNAQIGFFAMNRYRMYRRLGLQVTVVDGSTDFSLARSNKQGIALRARYGGALELSGAGCKITDAQV